MGWYHTVCQNIKKNCMRNWNSVTCAWVLVSFTFFVHLYRMVQLQELSSEQAQEHFFSLTRSLLSQQTHIYAYLCNKNWTATCCAKMCLNIRSKNRHMSSPQAVIQNVHIKLKSNSQTQRSACIQYREHLHCMLPGHAEISSSQVIVTDTVSSSWLHLSKNRSHFFQHEV